MSRDIDILIPTYNRSAALAVTLTSLIYQTYKNFRIIISDQTENSNAVESGEIKAIRNVLKIHGIPVEIHKHLPRRGMAEQRQFLLDLCEARFALFLDDDVILEPYVIENLHKLIQKEDCGFVGSSVIGLSYLDDYRPHEQAIELWTEPVKPESVQIGSLAWERHKLHNAANLYHVQEKLGVSPANPLAYRVAWIGAAVLYNAQLLRETGGFKFWNKLPPEHSGEDVLAQLRLMAQYGGCGMIPSGVYHQELPTTIPDRKIDAPKVIPLNWPSPPHPA
jgi:glycosyltransferase involved in cell wall biosynthesis